MNPNAKVMLEGSIRVSAYALRQTNAHNCDGEHYGIIFYGTDGTLNINRGGYELLPEQSRTKPRKAGKLRYETGDDVPKPLSFAHIRNFIDCVKSRKRPAADVEIGQRATTVPHLGNIALRTGRKIVWDAEKETIVGDPKAAKLLTRDYREPYVLPEV